MGRTKIAQLLFLTPSLSLISFFYTYPFLSSLSRDHPFPNTPYPLILLSLSFSHPSHPLHFFPLICFPSHSLLSLSQQLLSPSPFFPFSLSMYLFATIIGSFPKLPMPTCTHHSRPVAPLHTTIRLHSHANHGVASCPWSAPLSLALIYLHSSSSMGFKWVSILPNLQYLSLNYLLIWVDLFGLNYIDILQIDKW